MILVCQLGQSHVGKMVSLIDLINREKMVTKYFLKYLLLKSLIENYNEDIYRVFCEKVENKHTDLFP